MEIFWQLSIFIVLLILGYFLGNYFEKKHYKSILKREHQTQNIPLISFGAKLNMPDVQDAKMFVGSVVISVDYFKRISSMLVKLVGGRITVYESLLDRARREAQLRLKEQAIAWGAKQIFNVRLETATIGGHDGDNNSIGSVEVMAYGTAIK